MQLARGGVTNITFAPAQGGNLPCLLVNTSDSHVSIIDVVYHGQVLTNLVVRYRAKVEETIPLENFRIFSEMRILVKIRLEILNLVGYVEILAKFEAKLDFGV